MAHSAPDDGHELAHETPKRVFVSHSSKDRKFVEREIIVPLQRHGIQTWYSTDDIDTAAQWEAEILRGLQSCDWFVVALSDQSLRSRWVRAEVSWALDERSDRFVPIIIEDCEWKTFHLMLRTYQYADFRRGLDEARRRLFKRWAINYRAPSPQDLAEPQAFSVRPPTDFDQDVEKPIQKIKGQERARHEAQKRAPKESWPKKAPTLRRPLIFAGAAAVAVAIFLAIFVITRQEKPEAPPENAYRVGEPRVPSQKSMAISSPVGPSERDDGGKQNGPSSGSPTAPTPAPASPVVPSVGTNPGQTRDDNRAPSSKLLTNSIGMKLALIPTGEFLMGAVNGEEGAGDDEKPQHRVRITTPFYLGVYEVTQEEFERVMGRNPSWFSAGGGGKDKVSGQDTSRFPVEMVSWYDAVEFCNRLSEKESRQPYYRLANVERNEDGSIKAADVSVASGNGYRLPTEAEWEYACRAGTTTPFDFGTALNGTDANCDGNFPYGTTNKGPSLSRTTTICSYKPNAFGLYDMHGNVWEWCLDWYDKEYYGKAPETDPAGPSAGSSRVIRGGGWYGNAVFCRCAYRSIARPAGRDNSGGFRVASPR